MTEKGPFETATLCLGASRCMFNNQGQVEITNAIRVLEAAGKVDKAKALDGMEAMRAMMSRELFMDIGPTFRAVLTLIESLPEPEEERK